MERRQGVEPRELGAWMARAAGGCGADGRPAASPLLLLPLAPASPPTLATHQEIRERRKEAQCQREGVEREPVIARSGSGAELARGGRRKEPCQQKERGRRRGRGRSGRTRGAHAHAPKALGPRRIGRADQVARDPGTHPCCSMTAAATAAAAPAHAKAAAPFIAAVGGGGSGFCLRCISSRAHRACAVNRGARVPD